MLLDEIEDREDDEDEMEEVSAVANVVRLELEAVPSLDSVLIDVLISSVTCDAGGEEEAPSDDDDESTSMPTCSADCVDRALYAPWVGATACACACSLPTDTVL